MDASIGTLGLVSWLVHIFILFLLLIMCLRTFFFFKGLFIRISCILIYKRKLYLLVDDKKLFYVCFYLKRVRTDRIDIQPTTGIVWEKLNVTFVASV